MSSTDINLRLRELRRRKRLSQEELAHKLGITRQTIIAIEQGSSLPSLPVIVALLRVLDVPFQNLLQNDWSPFRDPAQVTAGSNEPFLTHYRPNDASQTIPIVIDENDKEIIITAELPGVKEEDITIDLGNTHLLIMAIKKQGHDQEVHTTHVQDITFGPILRIISLPCPIETSQAEATFYNGTIGLTLPKQQVQIKRRITFKKEKDNGSV